MRVELKTNVDPNSTAISTKVTRLQAGMKTVSIVAYCSAKASTREGIRRGSAAFYTLKYAKIS